MTDFAPDPYGIADEDSPDVAFNLAAEAPLDDKRLWPEDTGTLPFDARCALLQLVRGPYLHEKRDAPLWRALLNHRAALASRLADLFLELCVDQEAGVAFAHNAVSYTHLDVYKRQVDICPVASEAYRTHPRNGASHGRHRDLLGPRRSAPGAGTRRYRPAPGDRAEAHCRRRRPAMRHRRHRGAVRALWA